MTRHLFRGCSLALLACLLAGCTTAGGDGRSATHAPLNRAPTDTLTLTDRKTSQSVVVPVGTKVVFPEQNFKNGVLEVWYPQRTLVQLNNATKRALARLGDQFLNETGMQNQIEDGVIIFGQTVAGEKYTCTLSPGENFTLVRIHYGDWGDHQRSSKLANEIADML